MITTIKKTALLFGSQLLLLAIGFFIKYIQTHVLGDVLYGYFAFFMSFVGLCGLFFRFGIFSSLNVIYTQLKTDTSIRKWSGIGIIASSAIGLLFVVFVAVASFFIDDLFNTEMAPIILMVAPFTFIIPFRNFIEAYSIGTNKVGLLTIYDTFSRALYVLSLLVLLIFNAMTLQNVILMNLLCYWSLAIFSVYHLKPVFRNLNPLWKDLRKKIKAYGWNFYLGTAISQSTYKIDEITISYFVNTTINGYYTLANVLCSPIVTGGQALSNAMFKKMAHNDRISTKHFIANALWAVLAALILILIGPYVVDILFGKDFEPINQIIPFLSIAYVLHALTQPYMFLTAKEDGNAIKKSALYEAIFNIGGNILLVPFLGVNGAIITSIVAKLIHLITKHKFYLKYLKKNSL